MQKRKIVIAGSTGYVGEEFVKSLGKTGEFEVVGISRSGQQNLEFENYTVKKANLFSLKETEYALNGGHIGVFLVHSMLPNDRLAQGKFADFDYIIADNFARTAKKYNFEKIIYLGGLIPDEKKLSKHLKSRLEVEQVLGSYGVPCISIRSGLIIGAMGSSFQMMLKLVERLPIMIIPAWGQNQTQVIGIKSVVESLTDAVTRATEKNKIIELGLSQITSYKEILQLTAKSLGKTRFFLIVKLRYTWLSKIWVSIISGAPRSLTSPLVDSLKHKMVMTGKEDFETFQPEGQDLFTLLQETVREYEELRYRTPYAFMARKNIVGQVSSVQRSRLPVGVRATSAAHIYIDWLCSLPFIHTTRGVEGAIFKAPFFEPILILRFSKERSSEDRALYYVTGGLLAKVHEKGRFEFRETRDGRGLITALHNYRPRLPWYIYTVTQAPVHVVIMTLFGLYMRFWGDKVCAKKGYLVSSPEKSETEL